MIMIKMLMDSGLKDSELRLKLRSIIQERSIEQDLCPRRETLLQQKLFLERCIYSITSNIQLNLKTMRSRLKLNWRDIQKKVTDFLGILNKKVYFYQELMIHWFAFGTSKINQCLDQIKSNQSILSVNMKESSKMSAGISKMSTSLVQLVMIENLNFGIKDKIRVFTM